MNEIDFLYKLSELCEENDCRIEITQDRLVVFRHYGELNNKPYAFNQMFSIPEIEKVYRDLDVCADVFFSKLVQEKEKLRGKSDDTD